MKYKVLFFLFFISFIAVSQEIQNDSIYKISDIDVKPEFQGGVDKFYSFVGKNFRTPEKRKFKGKVIIEFVIENDGTLSNYKIIQDPGYGCGDEALRVLKLSPIWKPGEKNGKTIRTLYHLPITIEGA